MGVQVNSFPFGSLLTSAKMTALQDTVVHVLSHFTLDHSFNNSTVAGSHNNNVVNNDHAQTITGSKSFSKDVNFKKAIEVRSYISIGSGTNNAHIKLHSSVGGAEDNYIGYDSSQDPDALFFITNQLRSQVLDNAVEGSWLFGLGDGGFTNIAYKASSGQNYLSKFSVSTTGVVSAFHIPRAGVAFGGQRKVGNVTVSASTKWEDVSGVGPFGHLHCENFTVNAGVTISTSNNVSVHIHAVGSITINGIINGAGADGQDSAGGGGADGNSGIFGGSGGGGGGSASGGGDGGATFLTPGAAGGSGPGNVGGTGTDVSTFLRLIIDKVDVCSFTEIGEYGGEGGVGGSSGSDDAGEGGHGGNIIYLESPMIRTGANGILNVNGGNGGDGGGSDAGGGGAGAGVVIVFFNSFTHTGSISTDGGVGGIGNATGANGGPGGNGLVVFKCIV